MESQSSGKVSLLEGTWRMFGLVDSVLSIRRWSFDRPSRSLVKGEYHHQCVIIIIKLIDHLAQMYYCCFFVSNSVWPSSHFTLGTMSLSAKGPW
jgi:hypothetical protein